MGGYRVTTARQVDVTKWTNVGHNRCHSDTCPNPERKFYEGDKLVHRKVAGPAKV